MNFENIEDVDKMSFDEVKKFSADVNAEIVRVVEQFSNEDERKKLTIEEAKAIRARIEELKTAAAEADSVVKKFEADLELEAAKLQAIELEKEIEELKKTTKADPVVTAVETSETFETVEADTDASNIEENKEDDGSVDAKTISSDTVIPDSKEIMNEQPAVMVASASEITNFVSNAQHARSRSTDGVAVMTASTLASHASIPRMNDSAKENTINIMSQMTPGRTVPSDIQKQFFGDSKTAAFCEPSTRIEEFVTCGAYYTPTMLNLFRKIVADQGLTFEWYKALDLGNSVNWVNLDANPINKECDTWSCPQKGTLTPQEIAACVTVNEQIFLSTQEWQKVDFFKKLVARMYKMVDTYILDEIDTMANSFAHTYSAAGTSETSLVLAAVTEQIVSQSENISADGMIAITSEHFVNYLRASERMRQYTHVTLNDISEEFFNGLQIVTINNTIDSQYTPTPLSAGTQAVDIRRDWTVRLINPDHAFIGVSAVNEVGVEELPANKEDKVKNNVSYFGRSYFSFGRLVNCGWATIDFSNACYGRSVAAESVCA